MTNTRTTVKLITSLKKAAEKVAIEEDTTLQHIINIALEQYFVNRSKQSTKKFIIPTYDLGKPLDNLTRDDFY